MFVVDLSLTHDSDVKIPLRWALEYISACWEYLHACLPSGPVSLVKQDALLISGSSITVSLFALHNLLLGFHWASLPLLATIGVNSLIDLLLT